MNELDIKTTDREDSREGEKPSILKIMVENHEAIEQTVSLIKKQIATQATLDSAAQVKESAKVGFDGLNKLLTDSTVKGLIKSVAGEDTHNIIDKAIGAINSSHTMEDKHKAFASGIVKLKSNLSKTDKSPIKDDVAFKLAMSLVGLSREKLA